MGRAHQLSEVNTKWTEPIHYVEQFFEDAVLSGIDGEPKEFEWNISPGFTSIEIPRHIQSDLKARRRNPDQFEGRMKFMAVFNDIEWTKKENSDYVYLNAGGLRDYANKFSARALVIP